MRFPTSSRSVSAVAAIIVLALAIGACGSGSGEATRTSAMAVQLQASEYAQVLGEMRSTAEEGGSYDGYGFAEYLPKPQRAAIDAFCFVVDRTLESGDGARLADTPELTAQIVRKAEADLKAELNIVAPAPTRRAIRKLDAILDLGSLGTELAEGYVHACYR